MTATLARRIHRRSKLAERNAMWRAGAARVHYYEERLTLYQGMRPGAESWAHACQLAVRSTEQLFPSLDADALVFARASEDAA